MKKNKIILTGGAGFIGSCVLSLLNEKGLHDIIIIDNLGKGEKWRNLTGKRFEDYINKDHFIKSLEKGFFNGLVDSVIHMGACSSTTETDGEYIMRNNYLYSKKLASLCVEKGIRFIYASSGATYGDGSKGFSDEDSVTLELKPSNLYGFSKAAFDNWAILSGAVSKTAGLKFFNVFGPNEYHKGEMSSVVFKAYLSIKKKGYVELFESCDEKYEDGMQMRDFVYVKNCLQIIWWLLQNSNVCGIYNSGTGKPRTWIDLAKAVFSAMGIKEDIRFRKMPSELLGKYQNYTCAEMKKLKDAGYGEKFSELEESVKDYVQNYLEKDFAVL
ncbi:ADP-glyceromanno-heptose 6-epimerase [candidate division WOR-3 bacterium]|nr:ADP-glyceromanno-heptose 6-epimerase [candidate division WOR-3 bacterium]